MAATTARYCVDSPAKMHTLLQTSRATSKRQKAIAKQYKEACQRDIEAKFASRKWRLSPLRNFEYVKQAYKRLSDPRTEDILDSEGNPTNRVLIYERTPWTRPGDIWEMIYVRDEKAKVDPYAHWDYVTDSLSRAEMLRLAKWLEKN